MRPTDTNLPNFWEKTWRRTLEEGDKAGKVYQAPLLPGGNTTQQLPHLILGAPPSFSLSGAFTVPSGKTFEVEAKPLTINSGASLTLASGATFKTATTGESDLTVQGSLTVQAGASAVQLGTNGDSDVTVNGTFTLSAGAPIIRFGPLTRLVVNGTLNATSATLTGNPTWNGLYFGSGSTGTITGTSTSKSRIDKVTGGAGGAAVQVYNSSPLLQHTIIETEPGSYVYGVYASGSSGYSMSPTILYSLLRSRSAPALYKSGGTYTYVFVHDTDLIQESSYQAVYAASYGGISFWPGAVSPYVGYDKVKGGRLYASANATISAGSGVSTTSLNHFCDAAANTLEAQSGGTIYADYNYWYNGQHPVELGDASRIYADITQGTASCSEVVGPVAEQSTPGVASRPLHTERLLGARMASDRGAYELAFRMLVALLDEAVLPQAHSALLELGRLYAPTRDGRIQERITALAEQAGPLQTTARGLLAGIYAMEGQVVAADRMLRQVMQAEVGTEEVGTEEAFYAGLSLAYLLIAEGQYAAAAQVLNALEPVGEQTGYEVLAATEVLEREQAAPQTDTLQARSESTRTVAPVTDRLEAASAALAVVVYPNPFQATAKLRYVLPEAGEVHLAVYDVLGRRIVVLADAV